MYKLIEVANTHGGDPQYLFDLIDAFRSEDKNTGIKFQPFKYDRIATSDYSWYEVYKDLYFDPCQWKSFIARAHETKDVWIDLFDTYGSEILESNFDFIRGIKLQTSVLYNYEIFESLAALNLSEKIIVLNIAGRTLDQVDHILHKFQTKLAPQDIWLEVGFQGYPTTLEDCGVGKINVITKRYQRKIVFADHADGNSQDALLLPIFALGSGAFAIEKHVMLDDRETKYDHYSSLTPRQYQQLSRDLTRYSKLSQADFLNENEVQYLSRSEMKPLIKSQKSAGSTLSLTRDFIFRRSSQDGLTASQIIEAQSDRQLLDTVKNKGSALRQEDLRKAKIAAIIACRLKSTRLKQKALLKIGDTPSVEYCIKNALHLSEVDEVILATSNLDQDSLLEKYTYSDEVIFFQGSADDVLDRYLSVASQRDIDVIVRITADMPYIDNELFEILLNSHFQTGSDYTSAAQAAPGTNLEIINTNALERVKRFFPSAPYSEYMTWYFRNNPEYFVLNLVDLPANLIRDYRLTLDYEEDLELFNRIESHFACSKNKRLSISAIFSFLDQNPSIAAINSHLSLRYQEDKELIELLDRETKIVGSFPDDKLPY
jgi:spore coat polysaccharide biosynthesis protein SpsF (cytidylyltransferase family)/sialic acid synthase SpsE